jgi:hypothetical protein
MEGESMRRAHVAKRQIWQVCVLVTQVRVPVGGINKTMNFARDFQGWSRGFEP